VGGSHTSGDEKTGVIIIVDKGNGIVDVFYFIFFAFNWGGIVLGKQLGTFTNPRIHTMEAELHTHRNQATT
jgi:hypothetical protein